MGIECLKHPWLEEGRHLVVTAKTLHKLETIRMRRFSQDDDCYHNNLAVQVPGQVQVEQSHQGCQDDGQGQESAHRISSRCLTNLFSHI